jgi:hypothetical protein
VRPIHLAASSAALALALAACADTPTDPAGGRPLAAPARAAFDADATDAVWSFTDSTSAPVWLAFQEGDGAWTRVAPRTGGDSVTYAFSVRGRGGVAVVTRSDDGGEAGYELAVYYGTAAELASLGRCQTGPGAAARGKRLTGTVAGGGMMSQSTVSMGGATGMVMPMQSTFELRNVASGPQDLVAALSTFSLDGPTPSIALSKLIIRRGLDLADGAAIPTLDFAAGEAFEPAAAGLKVEGAAGGRLATSVSYSTAGGGTAMLSAGLGAERYYGVPSARQRPGDLHMLTVMALPAGGEEEEDEGLSFGAHAAAPACARCSPTSARRATARSSSGPSSRRPRWRRSPAPTRAGRRSSTGRRSTRRGSSRSSRRTTRTAACR